MRETRHWTRKDLETLMDTAPQEASERLFYDGDCGLCHHSVRFVLKRDETGHFRFAPLGGPTFEPFRERAVRANRDRGLPDSIVVVTKGGEVLIRSTAAAHVLRAVGGGWRIVGALLLAIPRPLRDLGYDAVARVRHRLFQEPDDVCPVPPAGQRELFDP